MRRARCLRTRLPGERSRSARRARATSNRLVRTVSAAHSTSLPHPETPPVEFTRGANLVGKAEVIGPAFLLRAPSAAPLELEDVSARDRARFDAADEIGASRLALDRDALDREVGLRGQHLLDQPLNLDRRYVACGADPGGVAVAVESSNVSLERLGGSRPREQFLQLPQQRLLWCCVLRT